MGAGKVQKQGWRGQPVVLGTQALGEPMAATGMPVDPHGVTCACVPAMQPHLTPPMPAQTSASPDAGLSRLDSALLSILVKDGRASFADIARQLGISRAHARTRVHALQDSGVIELFGAVINPEKLGKVVSTFLDIQVAPVALEPVAQELADCKEVVSLYIMSDLKSLHVHALTDSVQTFESFVHRHLFNRPEILSVECKTLLTRVKHRRGGARL
jgi:DNA-binding Lrp family transcriptional regulator